MARTDDRSRQLLLMERWCEELAKRFFCVFVQHVQGSQMRMLLTLQRRVTYPGTPAPASSCGCAHDASSSGESFPRCSRRLLDKCGTALLTHH